MVMTTTLIPLTVVRKNAEALVREIRGTDLLLNIVLLVISLN